MFFCLYSSWLFWRARKRCYGSIRRLIHLLTMLKTCIWSVLSFKTGLIQHWRVDPLQPKSLHWNTRTISNQRPIQRWLWPCPHPIRTSFDFEIQTLFEMVKFSNCEHILYLCSCMMTRWDRLVQSFNWCFLWDWPC